MHEFGYNMQAHREVPEKIQQAARQATLIHHEKRLAQTKVLTSQLKQLGSEYANELRSIIGGQKLKHLRHIRGSDVDSKLANIGIDIERMTKFKAEHMKKARLLREYNRLSTLDTVDTLLPLPPCQGSSDSWIVYSPPYPGSFWSYEWNRSDEPDDPVLTRILDQSKGQIGSSIRTRLSGADDDDFVNVDYYTAFKMWHQVRETGYLEAYLALRVSKLNYSRNASDEWGFSSFTLSQFTRPQLRILAPDETWEILVRLLYNYFEYERKAFPFLEWVFPANDIHWFYFKSDKIYSAGSWVLLEAALQNIAWFEANDYSITTVNDVDLLLDRVVIRSVSEVIA